MNSAHLTNPRTLLRLLRRRLSRRVELLRLGQFDEAAALEDLLAESLHHLKQAAPDDVFSPAERLLFVECSALADEAQALLETERDLLRREWLEVQVDCELLRLRRETAVV